MSEETLLSASRRARRFFLIDEAHGGLTSRDTLIEMDLLALQIEKETRREKERAEAAALGDLSGVTYRIALEMAGNAAAEKASS